MRASHSCCLQSKHVLMDPKQDARFSAQLSKILLKRLSWCKSATNTQVRAEGYACSRGHNSQKPIRCAHQRCQHTKQRLMSQCHVCITSPKRLVERLLGTIRTSAYQKWRTLAHTSMHVAQTCAEQCYQQQLRHRRPFATVLWNGSRLQLQVSSTAPTRSASPLSDRGTD